MKTLTIAKKRSLLAIIAIMVMIAFSACGDGNDTMDSVSGVSLNKSTLDLTVGETETLTATVSPSNATDKTVSWSSDNSDVVTVTDGTVTAVAAGSAIITVTTQDGDKTARCTVKVVRGIPVTFNSVTANGSDSQTTTTQLTLVFSEAISDLSAVDISLDGVSGVTKGSLSSSGATYMLPIYDFIAGGTLSITVKKSGYTISGLPKTVPIYTSSPKAIEMVSIPAGTFIMGSPATEPDRNSNETQHSVTLSGFSMSKYQVTQAQYQAVMGVGEDWTIVDIVGKGNNYPVYNVNWYDAIVFCNKLSIKEGLNPVYSINGHTNPAEWGTIPISNDVKWNGVVMDKSKNGYRLPTEAEWEYACRAGTMTAYNTGDTISDSTGWYSSNSGSRTHEVGLKPANAWGLYDMHGNLYEWCWDWLGDYSTGSQTDPTGAVSGLNRVGRGGYWYANGQILRSAFRCFGGPSSRGNAFGFRLVRS